LVLKTEGNTYSTLLHHPFLFKGKPTQAQEVAGRKEGEVGRGGVLGKNVGGKEGKTMEYMWQGSKRNIARLKFWARDISM
jgi:hypothetical protein